MSLDIRLKMHQHGRKQDLVRSPSQSQVLTNSLKQEGKYDIVENIMQAVDNVAALLAAPTIDPNIAYNSTIAKLHQHLKVYGEYLDVLFPDQLNRAFNVFRNSSQDSERLDLSARVHLLELIELRAQKWKGNDLMRQYYKKKMEDSGTLSESMTAMALSPNTAPMLSPGEVLKPSGKFKQPTRIPGKNYCKDEVVIRNADSGKVMGIKGRRVHMIEELSETIISFQRVNPGAKERLVQITGANEESINHAKLLIEDTIKRNASPVRESGLTSSSALAGSSSSVNSSASEESSLFQSNRISRALHHSLSTNDANLGEYKYTVTVGNDTIKITGNNPDLVRRSKLILDEYLPGEQAQFYSFDNLPAAQNNDLSTSVWPESLPSPVKTSEFANGEDIFDDDAPAPLRKPHTIENISPIKVDQDSPKNSNYYSVEKMARLSMSPLILCYPSNWEQICDDYPQIVGNQRAKFNVEQFLKYKPNDDNAEDDNA